MVMDSWPTGMRQYPEKEFESTPYSGISSDEDELTQFRTRTYPEYNASFVFKQCSTEQFLALRVFYNTTLNQTKPFSAPWLPAAGFDHHFCSFSNPPRAARSGLKWDLTIEVIIHSGVPVDGDGNILYGSVD